MYKLISNKLLLNPGPTNTSYTTKVAQLLGSDVCHRTEPFYEVIKETKQLLLDRFFIGNEEEDRENWHVSLIGGSGTTGMEAMVCSLSPSSGVTTIIAGKYGQRLKEMMAIYGIESKVIKASHVQKLTQDAQVKQLFFVENETTTGEKFDLDKIVNLYPNAALFVDATAAFGASHYATNLSNISAITFCANKCLQSTPGLGIVIWRKDLALYKRSYYLDLSKYMIDIPPFTIPVQSVYALHAALQEQQDNTELFDNRSAKIIKDLEEIGMKCINKFPCNSIMGFTHPTKSYEELRQFLWERNIVIYSGIEGYVNSFRISTMSVDFDAKYSFIIQTFYESLY